MIETEVQLLTLRAELATQEFLLKMAWGLIMSMLPEQISKAEVLNALCTAAEIKGSYAVGGVAVPDVAKAIANHSQEYLETLSMIWWRSLAIYNTRYPNV